MEAVMKNENLEKTLDAIESVCKPVSIFLYGSRAREDATDKSDYEIGVVLREDDYVGRTVLRNAVGDPSVSVYPFRYDDFMAGNPDTPFQKAIYMRELVEAGKTLRGENLLEVIEVPRITTLDILQRIWLDMGSALSATISHRHGDPVSAGMLYYKACLFATRCLVILKKGEFPLSYNDIYEASKDLDLGDYHELVEDAWKVRKGEKEYDPMFIFKNISFINQLVVPEIQKALEENGSQDLV